MRDVAFAFFWVLVIPLSLASSYACLLAWIWLAIFAPNDMLFGFMSDLPFSKAIAGLTILALVIEKEKKAFYVDRVVVFLALLGIVATISNLTSFVDTDDGWALFYKFIKELALAGLMIAVVRSRYRIHMAVFTVCLACGYEGVVEALEFIFSGGTHKVSGTPSVGDNNSLAVEILMSIPLLLYLIKYSIVRYVRAGLSVVAALSVVTVIATYSRGGFIGLLVLGFFYVVKSKNKFGGLALIAVVGGTLFALAPDNYVDRVHSIDDADQDTSFTGRLNAWKVSTAEALDSPLFGAGFHAVQRPEVWQHYRDQAEAMTIVSTPPLDASPHAAHSIYFEVLGDLGFAGLSLFCALLFTLLQMTRRVVKLSARHPSQAWAGDLAQMMQLSIVIYCVCGAALSMAYWEGLYIFVALISRLHRTVVEAVASEGVLATSGGSFARGGPIAGRRAAAVVAGRRLGRRT